MLACRNATVLPGVDATPYGTTDVDAPVRVRDVGGPTHAPDAADARPNGPAPVEDAPTARATHRPDVAAVAAEEATGPEGPAAPPGTRCPETAGLLTARRWCLSPHSVPCVWRSFLRRSEGDPKRPAAVLFPGPGGPTLATGEPPVGATGT